MANLVVILIILGCVAYQYLKGTLVKSFATVIITVCAGVVAFSYFELLAGVFISRSGSSNFLLLIPWAQLLSFTLLFVLAFAVLQTVVAHLLHKPVDLGFLPERIGRVIFGVLLGLILSGLLLTALAMAPLPNKYPYQRFDASRPDAARPNKVLLNADGFATGWFAMLSEGAFSGKTSFAAVHPQFIDQVFLNRHDVTNGVSIATGAQAIQVPARKKKAAWLAPDGLKDSVGRPLPQKAGHHLTIVRVGIKKNSVGREGSKFTLSQLRLICKERNDAKTPFTGSSKNVYPVGYLKTANRLQLSRLNDQIMIKPVDFTGPVRWIDFAFYVPNGFLPVLVEFKQNSIARVFSLVSTDQAPPTIPFIQPSRCTDDAAELQPISSARVYGIKLAAGPKLLADSALKVSDPNQWRSFQTSRSIKPAQFKDEKINYVRAELKIVKSANKEETKKGTAKFLKYRPKKKRRPYYKRRPKKYVEESRGISQMLRPLDGYRLLSLKCNNPSTGAVIKAEELPVLVELSGLIHHSVGIIASGKVSGQNIYEVDYCSLPAEGTPGGLTIAQDGSVARPFPDAVWLTGQAETITEFYVLYLVKSGRSAIITGVQSAGSQNPAQFKNFEGFLVK